MCGELGFVLTTPGWDVMKQIGILTIVAWVSATVFLAPLPHENIRLMEQSVDKAREALIYFEEKRMGTEISAESADAMIKSKKESDAQKIWIRWLAKFAVVIVGILAGVSLLLGWRYWKTLVIATSMIFIGVWALRIVYAGWDEDGSVLRGFLALHSNAVSRGKTSDVVLYYYGYLVLPVIYLFLIGFSIFFRRNASVASNHV